MWFNFLSNREMYRIKSNVPFPNFFDKLSLSLEGLLPNYAEWFIS